MRTSLTGQELLQEAWLPQQPLKMCGFELDDEFEAVPKQRFCCHATALPQLLVLLMQEQAYSCNTL